MREIKCKIKKEQNWDGKQVFNLLLCATNNDSRMYNLGAKEFFEFEL